MPRLVIEAHPDAGVRAVTLTERVVPVAQQNDHYLTQLIERINWALLDAEALERPPRE